MDIAQSASSAFHKLVQIHVDDCSFRLDSACRIGLASKLAATLAIANPIHYESVRFPSNTLLRLPQGPHITCEHV